VILLFSVPGRPRAKARPRVTRRGHAYTPKTTVEYERQIWLEALAAGGRAMMFQDRPLWLSVLAVFSPPVKTYPGDFPRRIDLDNILKCVCDGLRPAFVDDDQIVSCFVAKAFMDKEQLIVKISDSKEEIES
jgi:Holliday junction resolvase RusA-like endonuclease